MLTKNPSTRATIQTVLSHDWLTANGIQPVTLKDYSSIRVENHEKMGALGRVNILQVIRVKVREKILNLANAA